MASDAVNENTVEKPQQNGKKPRNTLLDNFSKLTSNQQKIRLKSGCQIIRHLARNSDNDDEYNYAISRLVRGLGASKINARIGFYTTLNVLLKTSDKYDVNKILDVIHKELKTSGQNLKSENADVYTGLILVCGALLHTGRFTELDGEKRQAVLQHLVEASGKKSYLGLLAASMIVDTLPKIKKETFSKDILPVFCPQLKKPLTDYTVDQLYLLLKCEEHFPEVITPKFLSNIISSENIVSKYNIKAIVHILLDITPSKYIGQHPIYQCIAQQFVSTSYLPKVLTKLDENFSNFTQVKHQVYCILLRHIVEHLQNNEHMPLIFGKNIMAETLRHFKTTAVRQQDEIKQAVINLLNSIVEWSKKDGVSSGIKVNVMEKLLFSPGTFLFEKVTGSKTLQSITATLDESGVKALCDIYKKVMLEPETKRDENFSNYNRLYAAQLIVKLINHSAMKNEHEWKILQLQTLMKAALIKSDEIGQELGAKFKETFFSGLDFKFGRLQDVILILTSLVETLNKEIGNLRGNLDETTVNLWEKCMKQIGKMSSKGKETHLTMVFHVLFLHMSLQLFNNVSLATDSLNELFLCYQQRKNGEKSDQETNGDELEWIEVVVDLFLNLLSHNSHLLRSVINRVFPHLCGYLTAGAIQQILHVLDPKSEGNPLSRDNEEDDEDDDDQENSDNSEENSESEGDEDDDSEVSEEDTHNDKLRQALHQVFLRNKKNQLENVENGENIEDSDIDMDEMSETEGQQLDMRLAEAFKQFRPSLKKKSKKQSKDDEILTHFRVRVMDLIDIYLDSPEVSLLNCLEIMLPLLQSLEFSIRDAHQKPLHDRIKSALKKLSSIKSFSVADVDEAMLVALLRSILDKGTKSALVVQEMGDKIADCCMLIINASTLVGCKKQIGVVLLDVLDSFFKKRDSLTPYVLFKMVLASNWERCVVLVPSLVTYVYDDVIRPFRRRQALELLRIFYLNNRLLAAHKENFRKKIGKCEMWFKTQTFEFLELREYKSKEPFICGLFLLLAAVKNCSLDSDFDWPKLGELVREYRSGIALSNDAKSAFSKLCSTLKISNIVKMKQKTVKLSLLNRSNNDEDDKDDEDKEEINKKKGNKEAKRLKKEARNLRLKSLSEGMTKLGFAGADVDDVNQNDVQDASDEDSDGQVDSVEDDSGDEVEEVNKKQNGLQKPKQKKKRNISESQEESPKKRKKKKTKSK